MTASRTVEPPKQAQIALQCAQVEELLVRGYATSTIIKRCRGEWQCSQQTVYSRIQDVRDAWRAEAEQYDRSAVRDAHRARLLKCYGLAVNRKAPLLDGEGNPVMSTKTNRPVMVDQPDLRAAAKFMDSLAKLDALNEETVGGERGKDLVQLMAMASVASEKRRTVTGEN